MKSTSKYYTLIWSSLLIVFIGCCFAACSKMDDSYKEYIEGGQIIYPGKADSARVLSGRNRLVLTWPASTDPKVTKAVIYWNNATDSIEIPVEKKSAQQPTISVPFNNLPEGTYVFEIVTFDQKGNKSVRVEAIGRVYGDRYEQSLLSRPIDAATLSEDTLRINWGAPPDTSAIGSEVLYTDSEGVDKSLFVPKADVITQIINFAPGRLEHRTLYLPSRGAIDTFYTEYATQRVKGPPIALRKQGWTATVSSFDDRSGANYRPGSNAIDENSATIWVSKTIAPYNVYPHTIEVDMGMIHEDLEGFAIITRVGDAAARPKTVELYTSIDGVEWVHHITTDLESVSEMQFIAFNEPVEARYFKMIALNAFNGNNIALAEIGLFTR